MTGYPEDMLDLDLDMEADLGIDTVKQAEMFAAIREEWDIPGTTTCSCETFRPWRIRSSSSTTGDRTCRAGRATLALSRPVASSRPPGRPRRATMRWSRILEWWRSSPATARHAGSRSGHGSGSRHRYRQAGGDVCGHSEEWDIPGRQPAAADFPTWPIDQFVYDRARTLGRRSVCREPRRQHRVLGP